MLWRGVLIFTWAVLATVSAGAATLEWGTGERLRGAQGQPDGAAVPILTAAVPLDGDALESGCVSYAKRALRDSTDWQRLNCQEALGISQPPYFKLELGKHYDFCKRTLGTEIKNCDRKRGELLKKCRAQISRQPDQADSFGAIAGSSEPLKPVGGQIDKRSCPPDDPDCFMCGDIPCLRGPECSGKFNEAADKRLACNCPQGEPCECYCSYYKYRGGKVGKQAGKWGGVSSGASKEWGKTMSKGTGRWGVSSGNRDVKSPAYLSRYSGEVYVIRGQPRRRWRVIGETRVHPGDTIEIGDGRGWIHWDWGNVRLEENTSITLKEELWSERTSFIRDVVITTIVLIHGAITSDVTKRDGTRFDIETSFCGTGVKGTKFFMSHNPRLEKTLVRVYDGVVEVRSASGMVDVGSGFMVVVTRHGHSSPEAFDPSLFPFKGANK
jgi:hypothetical protein